MMCLSKTVRLSRNATPVSATNFSSGLFAIPQESIIRHNKAESPLSEYRSEFMRDRDRILYCTAFRRLAGKTQIYTIGNDDHKRNRLTHTLEVAQISRTISSALGLDCNLAEAIALGHDLGHAPFGHAGEEMLNDIMVPCSKHIKNSPFKNTSINAIKAALYREEGEDAAENYTQYMFGFKHNIQSVRSAVVLEDCYRLDTGENTGLNLTNYTLWGIMNHTDILYHGGDEYPNYQNQFNDHLKTTGDDQPARSLEAYVVAKADSIAQWHHDLEDAIRGNALPLEEICSAILTALEKALESDEKKKLESIAALSSVDRKDFTSLSHIVINALVSDLIKNTRNNIETINRRLRSCCYQSKEGILKDYESFDLQIDFDKIVCFSDSIDTSKFYNVIKKSVHYSRDVLRMNIKGQYIIRKLFEAYCSNPQQLTNGVIEHFMVEIGQYGNLDEVKDAGSGVVRQKFATIMENPTVLQKAILMRRICDHIASMTDRYAIEEYDNLYG